jgi:hypothetical protein
MIEEFNNKLAEREANNRNDCQVNRGDQQQAKAEKDIQIVEKFQHDSYLEVELTVRKGRGLQS